MKKKSKKTIEREMNKIWRNTIVKRDRGICQVCKKKPSPKGLNVHHIIPRQNKKMRHDLAKGITLCSSCHKWATNSAHQNALWFTFWLEKNKPATFNYLKDFQKNDTK